MYYDNAMAKKLLIKCTRCKKAHHYCNSCIRLYGSHVKSITLKKTLISSDSMCLFLLDHNFMIKFMFMIIITIIMSTMGTKPNNRNHDLHLIPLKNSSPSAWICFSLPIDKLTYAENTNFQKVIS